MEGGPVRFLSLSKCLIRVARRVRGQAWEQGCDRVSQSLQQTDNTFYFSLTALSGTDSSLILTWQI